MSYLVLARKYRPQTFGDVVGQQPVVKTLQNSLSRGRVAHALLFSGVRGVGKTTLARLMAKALNCEAGPAAEPCNDCQSCRQILAGSALDLHEIDGASNRGIQEVRELKDRLKYLPTSARYKIIIIDEVHMLTNEAFNALLKTLEEPPDHVYFMFATTELHKIPITILSRCQRYELKRVAADELADHFKSIAEREGIQFESGALSLIVREAEGSVRDGLSLLDQVLSYADASISRDDVIEVLGLVNREVLLNLTRALLAGDRKSMLGALAETFRFGMDVKRFLGDLLEYYRALMLLKIGDCEELLDLPQEEIETFRDLAETQPLETIHHHLNLLLQTAEDIRYSVQPRLTLETAFMSIIESGSVVGVDTLMARLDRAIGALSGEPAPASDAETAKSPDRSGTSSPIAPQTPAPTFESAPDPIPPPPEEQFPKSAPEAPKRKEKRSPKAEAAAGDQQAPDRPPSPAPSRQRDVRKDWREFIAYLRDRKEWMAQNLQQASRVREENQELLLEFADPAECALLRNQENRQALTEYVLDFFQKEYIVHVVSPDESDDPVMKASEGPKKRRQQLAANPLVRMAEEIFNGRAGDIRIGPLSR